MSENLRKYTKAVYTMDAIVNRVAGDRWDAPSPCEDWTAREVLGHCIWALRYTGSRASASEPPAQQAEADVAGPDPATSWAEARDAVLESLDHKGVLATEVEGFAGPQTIDQSLQLMTMDLTVHSWDLARATGQDPVIPDNLATLAFEFIRGFGDAARRPGVFADEVPAADDAGPVARMAAMAGRRP